MIVLMGAGGNTGRVAAEALLARGEKVRVIGRDAGKLAALKARGAEVAVGDAADAAFLERAFAGADAAYTLIPPAIGLPDFPAYQDRIGEATTAALRKAGVRRVGSSPAWGPTSHPGRAPSPGSITRRRGCAGSGWR
jgi:uncharacterized protein YbjT (DUF2867 family)